MEQSDAIRQTAGISRADRTAQGRAVRARVPRESHGDWHPAADRRDPVEVLDELNASRLLELVPIRWGRMAISPFTFLRASAAVMAMDIATQEHSGITVQLSGDAHLSNFGMFATPERNYIFDLNDFEETLPGPFEWDVKRMAASFVVAARNNGFSPAICRDLARVSVQAYCSRIAEYAEMPYLDIWYARIDEESVVDVARKVARGGEKRVTKSLAKGQHHTHLETFPKLAENVGGEYVIHDELPLIEHRYISDTAERVRQVLSDYFQTLSDERKVLIGRYRVMDVALKVVGVGSVGTRCYVVLMMGEDERDPLFLQVKEAGQSVLSDYLGPSAYQNMGERVVQGQRLMQAASDMFLGWSHGEAAGTDFYFRQLRDMKLSAEVETMEPRLMNAYARLCGWTLARAHARSGDAACIRGYVGSGKVFSAALAEFGVRYADQTERDYAALREAVRSGRVEARLHV